MARVKRGTISHKRRKNVLRQTKGFRWGRKSKFRYAKEALKHALRYSFRDRKAKKRDFRQLWQTQINNAARLQGLSYSRFISLLKKKGVALDRKVLADFAVNNPQVFQKIIEQVK